MKATLTANKAKSLLEAGNQITFYTKSNGWVNTEWIEVEFSANVYGKLSFWVRVMDDREDGEWERQSSWAETLRYLKELGADFKNATIEKAA